MCGIFFMCSCDATQYAMVYTHQYAHVHIYTQKRTWAFFPVWSTRSWFESGQHKYVCVCVYIYIYDCPVRLCLFEKTRACEHTHSHVGTDLKKFIDLTLHCLLPHCRSLCILADPFYFYFCAKSLTVICVLLLFLNTSGILFFLCTGNVFCLFCFSTLLCLPSCFFGHFCLETYVRVTVFSCACAHALCDSHRSAWHWGLRELDFV